MISSVRALSIKNGNFVVSNYDSNENGTFFHNNINFGNNVDRSFTITGGNNLQGYDYVTFGFTLQYSHNVNINETTSGQNTTYNYDNGNLRYYCSQYGTTYQTYADGTQSIISVCDRWTLDVGESTTANENQTINESTSGTYSYNPNIQFAIYAIYDTGNYSLCSIEHTDYGTSLVSCPIADGATTINTIRIRNIGSTYYAGIYGRYGITAYHTFIKDPMSILNGTISSGNQQIINNQNQNQQETMNADVPDSSIPDPDTVGYDSYQSAESSLKESMQQADLSSVSVSLDSNNSSWIWTNVLRLIRSHTLIFSMVTSLLSIGIIKLALGR